MTKGEQTRLTAWRWRILQQAADELNVARVCRHFGISRKSFYKWKRRHAEHGAAGLCDRARTPHRSPRAASSDVIRKILYLREQYHFGPARIAMYLHRFHQITIAGSSVHRILKRHGMNRLPANQKHRPYGRRWKRDEKLAPGHRLQVDVKFLERIPARVNVYFNSQRLTTALGFASSRSSMHATTALRSNSSTKSYGDCHFACTSCRPTTVQNSNRSSTGI